MFIGGLDLGQVGDYAALVVVKAQPSVIGTIYDVGHLHRWFLGETYPTIERDTHVLWRDPLLSDAILCVDRTGVGRPVVDQYLYRAEINICAITITGGSQWSEVDNGYNVPKKDLVAIMQLLLQQNRLHIAKDLELAEILLDELRNFRMTITAAMNETFESGREGKNDDLILATALPCWLNERIHVGAWDTGGGQSENRCMTAELLDGPGAGCDRFAPGRRENSPDLDVEGW